ncbi:MULTISPECIES: transposase [Streptomyces]|uniref:Transposase n=2 Tax=Streptomyces TaxID=1883 RepID=A0ABV9IYM7_9ACTN
MFATGTILVDVGVRRPVDVLPDRTSETLAAWLHDHPGAEVVCRDRASAYTRAVKEAAPNATEVADRWHPLRNLSLAVEKTCNEHRVCLQKYAERTQRAELRMPALEALPTTLIVDRVLRRHEEINRLVDVGYPLSELARRLGLDRKTMHRYRDTSFDVLLASARDRRNVPLDVGTLRDGTAVPAPAPIPAPRKITGWIMRPREVLPRGDADALEQVRLACPDITNACDLARAFTDLVRHRRGHLLGEWIRQAERCDLRPIRSFASFLRQEIDAVTAGLTLSYRSGVVESAESISSRGACTAARLSPCRGHGFSPAREPDSALRGADRLAGSADR